MPALFDFSADSTHIAAWGNKAWAGLLDPETRELVERAPLPGLGGGPRCPATAQRIELWRTQREHSPLMLAGLWLLAGELEKSHAISQNIDSPAGSAWHGIMHRREGDFWNAKYWFRKAAGQPLYRHLRQYLERIEFPFHQDTVVKSLLGNRNLAESLVDCVAAADALTTPVLEQVCWCEWQILFFLHAGEWGTDSV